MKCSYLKYFLLFAAASSFVDGFSNNTEIADEKVLSRRKRFLIFPPGANILVTGSLVKAMVWTSPKGFTQIFELDLFIPLPNRARFWQKPADHQGAAPPPPPPTTPSAPPANDDHQSHDPNGIHYASPDEVSAYVKDHPDTFIPPGYNLPMTAMKKNWLGNKKTSFYQNPFWQKPQMSYPENMSYNQLRRSNSHQYIPFRSMKKRGTDIDDHQDWEHYYHYRDRRDLYDLLTKAFPGLVIKIFNNVISLLHSINLNFTVPYKEYRTQWN